MAGLYRDDYAAIACVCACAHADLQMKNDGGPVGIWLLSKNQGACAQFLCLPYGMSRPALLFLPFFSPCAASSKGRVKLRIALFNTKDFGYQLTEGFKMSTVIPGA